MDIDLQHLMIKETKSEENKLFIELRYKQMNISFNYDRSGHGVKSKKIFFNNELVCDLSVPQNDPLDEIVERVLLDPESIDFNSNRKLTLKTELLLSRIHSFSKLAQESYN